MKYNVILETTAISDLHSIFDYIADVLKEPNTAAKIFSIIQEKIISLNELPHRQSLVKDEPYKSMGVRWLLIENYTTFYIVDEHEQKVHVLRILYNRRIWQNLL